MLQFDPAARLRAAAPKRSALVATLGDHSEERRRTKAASDMPSPSTGGGKTPKLRGAKYIWPPGPTWPSSSVSGCFCYMAKVANWQTRQDVGQLATAARRGPRAFGPSWHTRLPGRRSYTRQITWKAAPSHGTPQRKSLQRLRRPGSRCRGKATLATGQTLPANPLLPLFPRQKQRLHVPPPGL